MRCLARNKRSFYYASYTNKLDDVLDENGLKTGEHIPRLSCPKKGRAVFSFSGQTVAEYFGLNSGYSGIFLTERDRYDIDETSVLWLEAKPSKAHDYAVVSKISSLNFTVYGIRAVSRRYEHHLQI